MKRRFREAPSQSMQSPKARRESVFFEDPTVEIFAFLFLEASGRVGFFEKNSWLPAVMDLQWYTVARTAKKSLIVCFQNKILHEFR